VRRRAVVLTVVMVSAGMLGALLLGEVLAVAYYWMRDGQYVSPGDRLVAQRNVYAEEVRTKDCHYGERLLAHPFLGSVESNLGPCGSPLVNSKGLLGKEFPDATRRRTGILLVTGGSVAAQFTSDNRETESPLERILNEQFTGERFDRFIVLNGGLGGWKQPNQFILFGLYADVLDGVITLDGFNEHYMLWAHTRNRFEWPSNAFFHTVQQLDRRSFVLAEVALRLDAELYRLATRHRLFQISTLGYWVLDVTRGWLRGYAAGASTRTAHRKDNWVNASYERMFTFGEPMSDEQRWAWTLDQYAKYIRLMHAGAKELDVQALFLLQPTPAYDKPLTAEEKKFVEGTNRPAYDAIIRQFDGLRINSGLPAYSLLNVFHATPAQVYLDSVHVNHLGNELIAERIADLIEKVWGWPRRRTPLVDQIRPGRS